ERYAELLPEGPGRTRAAATARSVATLVQYDVDHLDGYARAFAAGVESVDYRILGTWSAQGAEAVLRNLRSWFDLSDDVTGRYDACLAPRADAFLARTMVFGTDRASGGAFERPNLGLWAFGTDGLITRWELFDVEREAAALARFDELGQGSAEESPPVSRAARIENAATRTVDRFTNAWAARDWEGIAALYAPGFGAIDHRSYAHLDLDRDQHLVSLRFRFEMRSSRVTAEVLATRGQRLVLLRQRFGRAAGDVGPSEAEWRVVAECDERGGYVALVVFDPDALDAAYAELDRRHAAGEATADARARESSPCAERASAAKP